MSLRRLGMIPEATIFLTFVLIFPVVITCVNLLSLKRGLVTVACQRLTWILTVVAVSLSLLIHSDNNLADIQGLHFPFLVLILIFLLPAASRLRLYGWIILLLFDTSGDAQYRSSQ